MAKKKLYKPTGMFPSLHEDVLDAVSDHITSIWFQAKDNDTMSNNRHPTHIKGSFYCNNKYCSTRSWGSKKVAILIRGYPSNGYNAVVFN